MGLTVKSVDEKFGKNGFMIKHQEPDTLCVALAGNPNVGKSTVFNGLTGLHQHTGNWSGKTVTNAVGYAKTDGQKVALVDLPGCYSLSSGSAEEEVAKDYILAGEADAVIVVCDATCLERNLILALEVLKLESRVVLCINLMDEAKKKQIEIDLKKLEDALGIPVVATEARGGRGLKALLRTAVEVAQKPNTANKNELVPDGIHDVVRRAEAIAKQVITQKNPEKNPDRKIDKILTGRIWGFPIMFAMFFGIFWITIVGANLISETLSELLFRLEKPLSQLLSGLPWWLHGILVDGAFRVTAWVVSVMLPPMAIFFPLFTILEDLGYLPRIAFNLDRCFQKCRACGKQALTMCMGVGCNAVGVVGCRIIDSPRERLVAILTNSFVPCNGRFPFLIVLLTIFFAGGGAFFSAMGLAGLIIFGILVTFGVSFLLSKTILSGMPSSFTLELPPYRMPRVGRVIVRSVLDRTVFVLCRALVSAAPAGIIIWLLANLTVNGTTILKLCTDFLDPFAMLFGMDGVILMAFIMGLPANEIVMPIMVMAYVSAGTLVEVPSLAELKILFLQNGWTHITAICTMLFSLMHWPCATTLLTIRKETKSMKWTVAGFLIPTVVGLFICFLFANIARLFA